MLSPRVVCASTLLASAIFNGTFASPTPLMESSCSLDSYTIVPDNGTGTWPYRKYQTTSITSPVFQINRNGSHVAPGLLFLTLNALSIPPGHGEYENGAYIMTNQGDLVWGSGNLSASSNFRTQTLYDKPVMSYWRPVGDAATAGHGYGEVLILNSKLETIHTICPEIDIVTPPGSGATCFADIHESYITPQNTMLITAYNITQADLTTVGGPSNGYVYDSLAVEVDIETNKVIWSWSPLGHIPIANTHSPLNGAGQNTSDPFDWFHMNSAQPIGKDYFLINSKNLFTTYLVNRNGSIMWTINGVDGGDFGPLPDGMQYSWQHHARLHPSPYNQSNQALLTYFADNNVQPSAHANTSIGLGLLLHLPPSPTNPPKLYSALFDPSDKVAAFAEGSHQLLGEPNPNSTVAALLGYGIVPTFKEFSAGGEVSYSVNFGYRNLTHSADAYRVFKKEWHATPSAPLDLVVRPAAAQDGLNGCANGAMNRGYVSWNGATDVQTYTLLAGSEEGNVAPVSSFARKGFETEFVVPQGMKYVQIEAVEDRQTVGRSGVMPVM